MLLEQWIEGRTTVVDPFCGSGTTLVEAQLLGHRPVGVDLNPLAVAIARGKLQNVLLEDILYRLTDLSREFSSDFDEGHIPEGLRVIYHPRTLAQLCYLRHALDQTRTEDLVIQAAVLGIMHGKSRRDDTTAYLSIDMPNTFSMSPEYVRRFVERHQLRQIPADVFGKLRERLAWLYREGPLRGRAHSTVLQGDATRLPELLKKSDVRSVGAIITSPPYLGILRYGAFNWIRLWFLNHEPTDVDRVLDGTDSLDAYLSFMVSFLRAAAEVVPVGAPVILVIGDVVEQGQHVKLAPRVWEELEGLLPFDLEQVDVNRFDVKAKTTRIWGEDKKGRATPVDRILVLLSSIKKMEGLVACPDQVP